MAGRYRTIARVGSGGMATVLLAEDERLGRRVAVKLLHAESPEDTARRFRREARLGASLNHPNLVSVYDIVTDDEGVLIVMEYVEGETLRDALEGGPLEPGRAIEVLRGLAAGLDHAHDEGIVHRDVKPANVLLGSDGRVKLADLGIATAVEGTRITRSGTVLGTAAYMAPEQLEGHNAGPAADVYSLAVLAWETLAGRRAYEGRTPLEIAHRKAVEPPPPLDEGWPHAPPAAVAVLARTMGADPEARPATASAFVEELARALEPAAAVRTVARPAPEPAEPITAVRAWPSAPGYVRHGTPRARRSWLVPAIVLLAFLAIGALAVSTLGGGSTGSSRRPAASSAPKKPSRTRNTEPAQPAQQPQAPAPAAPTYQIPRPSGTSVSDGQRLNDQGFALSNAGKYSQAIPLLERSVRSFPASAAGSLPYSYALFNLGHALRLGGRPADAVPVLEERLKNPDQRAKVQAELDAARAAAGRQ
jgi:eukaryotic-like serine/threonine-protein kinase